MGIVVRNIDNKDIKRLAEVTQDLINTLALFNGLCLAVTGHNDLTTDECIDSLLIDLQELLIELNKAS